MGIGCALNSIAITEQNPIYFTLTTRPLMTIAFAIELRIRYSLRLQLERSKVNDYSDDDADKVQANRFWGK